MSFTLEEHPVYPVPTRVAYAADPDGVREYVNARAERIRLEREDPYLYGYRPGVWARVEAKIAQGYREVLVLGGNRASKSEYAGLKVVEMMLGGRAMMGGGPKRSKRVWCLQSTESNSIEMQQAIVWKYIPAELKNIKKGRVTNISYTQKNGFSQNKFIFPNGSECIFRNYAQDFSVAEGGECDLIWADELIPIDLLSTLRYRLVTRAGLLLITFTPIEGYSATVKEFLDGAKTVREEAAPLLGGRLMPREQHCVRRSACVVYFWTSDNPFGGYENLVSTLEGAPAGEIMTRAYGVPMRSLGNRFPGFRERRHVLEPGAIPAEGSRYMFVDPASSRNWFMSWVLVDVRGRHYVYREWPCEGVYLAEIGDPGPWAEADGKRADGRPGPAQSSFGWGLRRYLEEIKRLEGEEEIVERWMDSRFGNSPTSLADGATTLLEECANLGMAFAPAPADPVEEGVSLINSMLDFGTPEQAEPLLYISSACPATIFSLRVWTGKDLGKGACKDPIDTLRWAAVAGLVDAAGDMQLVEPSHY